MKDYRDVIRFSWISVKETFRSVTFWLVLLVIFLVIQYMCGGAGEYLHMMHDRMNLFEIYIWFNSSRQSHAIYVFGFMVLVCGITFFHKGASYYLLRINRRTWVLSQIIFLTVLVFLFNILILVSFWISCKGALSFIGEWSDAAFTACQFGIEDVGISSVLHATPRLLRYNPNMLGIVTFFQQILIGLIVGMVLLAFQAKDKVVVGIIAVLGFWFGEVMLRECFSHPALAYLTPFRLSSPTQLGFSSVGPSPIYAFCYLIVFCVILECILLKLSKQVDFVKME